MGGFELMRKVAIVGNGPGLLKSQHGAEVDEADAVVRINYYRIDGYAKHVGTRTDYWVNHLMRIAEDVGDYVPPGLSCLREVWLFARWEGYETTEQIWEAIQHPKYKEALRGVRIRNTSYKEYFKMHREVGERRPSNGYGAISLALKYLDPDELLMLGFDVMLVGVLPRPVTRRYAYYWGYGHEHTATVNISKDENIPMERTPLLAKLAASGFVEKWSENGCALFAKTETRESNGES